MPLNKTSQMLDSVRTVFSGSHAPPWTEGVVRVIAELERLNRTTETAFLTVGRNLMTFLSASRQLHGEMVGLTALVSGVEAQHACDGLLSVLTYVRQMQQRSEGSGRALLALQKGAACIRREFSTFEKIVLSFRITAIASKIEVAHLATSEQNLESLARDVRSCIEKIEALGAGILETVADFDSRVALTLHEVSRLEAICLRELPALLVATNADLDAFRNRQREAATLSSKLAGELDSVTRELSAVAVSIQFHDITRQQVEHVIEALQELVGEAQQSPLSAERGALIRLQRAQLQNAAAAFTRSTGKIELDLKAIATTVAEMASARNSAQAVEPEDNESFLCGMQRRFGEIARAVAELDSLVLRTRATVDNLRDGSQRLRGAVRGIQSIESQFTHISINAMVSACHLGSRGAALHVVAAAIQELKTDCASRSGNARAALDSIGEVINVALAGDASTSDASGEKLLEDLNTRISGLQSASAASARATAKVAVQAEDLRAGLLSAGDGFRIGLLFADTAHRCCDLLDHAASQAQPSDSPDADLAALANDRYTMEAERSVHRALSARETPMPFEGGSHTLPEADAQEVEFF